MVNRFDFLRSPKIIFGMDRLQSLPAILPIKATQLLVITGLKSYAHHAAIEVVLHNLERDGFTVYIERIAQEPSPVLIDDITGRYKSKGISAIVSIGGGSALDAGKAVSAMLPVEGSVRDYLEGVGTKKHTGAKIFFIAVPTTSGTGSEATANAVISETGVHGFKRSLRHENFVPDIALVDPALTIGLPADITANCGMDAFTQLVESYLSLKGNHLTDALALEGIAWAKMSLMNAVLNGSDPEARTGMAYAALLSGITLANGGLGLIHGFASSIGGLFSIPHGAVCGTLMAVVNRYNITKLLEQSEDNITRLKYARLGKLLSDRDDRDMNGYIKFVAEYLEILTGKLPLRKLGEYGITEQDLDGIAAITDHKYNPVKFDQSELVDMLRNRL
jgi:alcohol dehydrogenase class IV